ncbi:MAG: radical SAM protein [Planctomycetes bacterium]|nr:radical SAM protein [Planctomycetota bacterium]
MRAAAGLCRLASGIARYRLARLGIIRAPHPVTLTFSVTNMCNSRCRTCKIWRLYQKHPERAEDELTVAEIERIFRSMRPLFFFNVSGGEPFLRDDIHEIVGLACRHLRPAIVHIPTNAIDSDRTVEGVGRCLEAISREAPGTAFTVKPSIDGIGKEHDRIRGAKGNFDSLMRTIEALRRLSNAHLNLHLELGTVVSKMNMHSLSDIASFVHNLGVQSYRNEIAEQRSEFFNVGDSITPTAEEYERLMHDFSATIRDNLKNKRTLARMTESLRLVYYQYAPRILRENRQVLPCYAGTSNVHMTPHGDLWPCCTLGYEKPMGNLREAGYDFNAVWRSHRANTVRKYIRSKKCACPLANQAYSNIACNFKAALQVIWNVLFT